jgi:predicted transcriptional regulator
MRIKVLLLLFFLLSFKLHSQYIYDGQRYVEGKIVLKTGREISGNFKMPKVSSKFVSVDISEKKSKVLSSDIDYLIIKVSDYRYKMIYTGVSTYRNFKKEDLELSSTSKSVWLAEILSGERVLLYMMGQVYSINRSGKLLATSSSGMGLSAIKYYAKIKGRDEKPIWVSQDSGNSAVYFKRFGSKFFKGVDNDLSTKILKGKKPYKYKNIQNIFRDFK